MRQLVEAGFDTVFIGIETPTTLAWPSATRSRTAAATSSPEAAKRLQHAGLQVQGGFIVGFDSDTATTFRRQMEFIQRSGIVAMVGLLNALPDTKLHARLAREGRLLGRSSGGDNPSAPQTSYRA